MIKFKLFPFLILFSIIITTGFGCRLVDSEVKNKMKPITLNYWRVFDDQDAFDEIISKYKNLHPFIKINYRKLRYSEYQDALLEAYATNHAPDIFSIHNTWMKKYYAMGFLSPMPEDITMAYPVAKGTIKKQIIPELRTTKSISLNKIKNDFVDVVYNDAVIKKTLPESRKVIKKVYGLPLFVDTLIMFINRDLFNNAGITSVPQYWDLEFHQNVKKLTKQNIKGEIIQSGVALGGSDNIERSADILSVLMMQNRTEMMTPSGIVMFDKHPDYIDNQEAFPGVDALRFYTQFANPSKEVYCWNKQLPNSLDLFIQGKLAIMFGYSYMIPQIKSRAPKLNLSINKLPQIKDSDKKVNFANYWLEVVSSRSKHKDEAWDFIQFITKAEQAKLYLDKTKKPTALRSLIDEQTKDQRIGMIVDQVLTAKSWYRGADVFAAEAAINQMIDQAVADPKNIMDIINSGASKVQQTISLKTKY